MVTEMKTEALDMCATALEDHPSNNEVKFLNQNSL